MFFELGYEFVFSSNGEFFRKILKGESDYPVKVPTFWLDHETIVEEEQSIPTGLCFVQSPATWKSFVINLPLQLIETGYKCTITVLLPNPNDTGFEQLIGVQENIDSNPLSTISFVPVKNFLQEKILDAYPQTWQSFFK